MDRWLRVPPNPDPPPVSDQRQVTHENPPEGIPVQAGHKGRAKGAGMSGVRLIAEAMNGNLLEVRKVVANGIDVNFANRLGVTALMVACQWDRLEVAEFLLANGADLEIRERNHDRNALIYSCLSGDSRIVKLLLDHGVFVNSTDAAGTSALMTAATMGNVELVKLLLQRGANVHLRDHLGAHAWDWASVAGRDEILEVLNPQGAVRTVT
jgi:ankyrin repeat protein